MCTGNNVDNLHTDMYDLRILHDTDLKCTDFLTIQIRTKYRYRIHVLNFNIGNCNVLGNGERPTKSKLAKGEAETP